MSVDKHGGKYKNNLGAIPYLNLERSSDHGNKTWSLVGSSAIGRMDQTDIFGISGAKYRTKWDIENKSLAFLFFSLSFFGSHSAMLSVYPDSALRN